MKRKTGPRGNEGPAKDKQKASPVTRLIAQALSQSPAGKSLFALPRDFFDVILRRKTPDGNPLH